MRATSWRLAALLGSALTPWSCSRTVVDQTAQRTFPTPDAAAEALAIAVSGNDTSALLAIMGPESRAIVLPSDQVQAANDRQVVAAAMAERWWLEEPDSASRTLVIGNESWPFPIPIVHSNGAWRFDTEAGKDELLYRRVGANETAVMELAAAFVEAQREYASAGRDGQPKGIYAQRFVSEPGRHDGLYWPVSTTDTTMSPMGELAAKAAADGYKRSESGPTAYHGYYFKVLTSQGPNAPGGARSYVTNGKMRGGFALLAWPADYGTSGVMTFVVGPDGVLHEKDLGAETKTLAPAIAAFDPDSSWIQS
jgi:hypothetical protein